MIVLQGTSVVLLSSGLSRQIGSVVVESMVFQLVGPVLQLSTFAMFVTVDWLSLNAKSGMSSNWMSVCGFESMLHWVPPRTPPEFGAMPANTPGFKQAVTLLSCAPLEMPERSEEHT